MTKQLPKQPHPAETIINGIVVNVFENDEIAEKAIRRSEGLIRQVIDKEIEAAYEAGFKTGKVWKVSELREKYLNYRKQRYPEG